jgi:hypothetical protein
MEKTASSAVIGVYCADHSHLCLCGSVKDKTKKLCQYCADNICTRWKTNPTIGALNRTGILQGSQGYYLKSKAWSLV